MCIARTTPFVRKQIVADSSTTQPRIILPWMLKHGVDTLRVTNELQGLEVTAGTFTQEVRFRYASVLTSQPGAWQTPGSAITRTADGSSTDDVDVSGTTNQMWVQAALFAQQSSGVGQGQAGYKAQVDGVSKIVGARSIENHPYLNTSQTAYFPVGDPFPSLGLSSLMFAFVITGVSGTITYQPAWRTFEALGTEPGAWADIGSANSDTGNDTYNSGSISVSPGSVAMVQAGISITTAARATLQVLVAGAF